MTKDPTRLAGYGTIRPFGGSHIDAGPHERVGMRMRSVAPGRSKLLKDIDAALDACGLRDGGTISFIITCAMAMRC